MPLYEMIYMVNPSLTILETSELIKKSALHVLKNGGVIRRLSNMGILSLSYPMYRAKKKYYKGRHVYLLFDASTGVISDLNRIFKMDEAVFRYAIYKQKDNFRELYDELYYHYGVPRGELQKEMMSQQSALELHEELKSSQEYTIDPLAGANYIPPIHELKEKI